VTNIYRDSAKPVETTILYYLMENLSGNMTDASRTQYLLHLYSEQETAIALGYPVVLQGESELFHHIVVNIVYMFYCCLGYVPLPDEPDKKLWIIGAVLGGLLFVVCVVWCILFTYFKCTQPITSPRRSPRGRKVENGKGEMKVRMEAFLYQRDKTRHSSLQRVAQIFIDVYKVAITLVNVLSLLSNKRGIGH
jgi:hypothetical protein